MKEHDARGNGGGFAPLEASLRRVAGVSSQSSARPFPPPINVARNSHAFSSNVESTSLELQRFRVVSKSDRGKLRAKFVWRLSGLRPRVPWLAQCLEARPCSPDPPPSAPGCISGCRGGFAPLEASCRRVAGVSRLYWCNSPRLLAPSTWGELDRAPLKVQFLRLRAMRSRSGAVRPRFGAVRSRFGVVWRPKCRPPRRQTSTTGCRWRGGLRSGYNGALPRAPLAHSPLRCEREPAITCANPQYRT